MHIIEAHNQPKRKLETGRDSAFPAISSSKLNDLLDNNAYLLTSNQRLSRFRISNYEIRQLQSGKTAWHTPHILPWSAWLRQQWQQFGNGVWLSTKQEALLWRDCILSDTATQILNTKALSKQAMEAWNILSDFQIDSACLENAGEEHASLLRWGKNVTSKSEHILQHQVLNHLTATTLNQSSHTLPCTIILDGFDDFSPAQSAYLKQLEVIGYQIFEVQNDAPSANTSIFAYTDSETELRGVCEKIRAHLVQYPEHHIGVFVPDLEQNIAQISRVFREELVPVLSYQVASETQGDYFNISLGSVLGKQPLIQTAFTILSMHGKTSFRHDELSDILLNPYITGFGEEREARAALDVHIRQSNQSRLSLQQFLNLCQQSTKPLPSLIQVLEMMLSFVEGEQHKGRKSLSHWMVLAEEILKQQQWHQQAYLAEEQTQVQNWQLLIQQLTSLDDFCGNISWQEALSRMQEHALELPFRPAPGQANIQIMGLLEAVNLHFDRAFLLGMDDHTWPASAKPNPLIPFDIQVKYQTPHANSEREWTFAQNVWQHIRHVSPQLDISFAKNKEQREMQLSPLVMDCGKTQDIQSAEILRYANVLQQQQANIAPIKDTPLSVTKSEPIRGGTGLLKAQSACSFQAFARYRLHLQGLKSPILGLNAGEQGTLLHAVLEVFWQKTKTHAALIQLIEQQRLDSTIVTCIREAWHALPRYIPPTIQTIEEERLQKLLSSWLLLESTRDGFEVKETEVWRNITVGQNNPLQLHAKLDRIDENNTSHRVIIDYKTGETSPTAALGSRPDEPQIPAYYLGEKALGNDVSALAFAQVKHGSLGFKGFAHEDHLLQPIKAFKGKKGEPNDWQELTSLWQTVLDALADEFMVGKADVSPKSSKSCMYCELAGLCQIQDKTNAF